MMAICVEGGMGYLIDSVTSFGCDVNIKSMQEVNCSKYELVRL